MLVFPKKLRNATEGEKEGKLINTSSGWSFVSSEEGKMGKFMHFPPLPCHNNIFEIIGAPHSCTMIPPLKVTLVNKAYFERDTSDVRAELRDLKGWVGLPFCAAPQTLARRTPFRT